MQLGEKQAGIAVEPQFKSEKIPQKNNCVF